MSDWLPSMGFSRDEWESTVEQLQAIREIRETAPPLASIEAPLADADVEQIRARVAARLQQLRESRERRLSIDEFVGARRAEEAEAVRAGLAMVDTRVDELWNTWMVGAAHGHPPFSWQDISNDMVDSSKSEYQRRKARDAFAVIALSISLLALLGTLFWALEDRSAAGYVSAWSSAVAAAFITFYHLNGRVSATRVWLAALAPPVTLAVALGISMLRDELDDGDKTAAAAAVVVVLAGLMLAVVAIDRRGRPRRLVVRQPVKIPAGTEDAEYAQRLGDYLEDLRVAVLRESVERKNASRVWQRWFIILGAGAALLSAGAGVTGLSGQVAEAAAIAALLGAGLSATVTLLNPSGQAQQAAMIGSSCGSLAEEINVLIRIDLPRELRRGLEADLAHVREQVETISTRFDELRDVPQRPRLWQPPGAGPQSGAASDAAQTNSSR